MPFLIDPTSEMNTITKDESITWHGGEVFFFFFHGIEVAVGVEQSLSATFGCQGSTTLLSTVPAKVAPEKMKKTFSGIDWHCYLFFWFSSVNIWHVIVMRKEITRDHMIGGCKSVTIKGPWFQACPPGIREKIIG